VCIADELQIQMHLHLQLKRKLKLKLKIQIQPLGACDLFAAENFTMALRDAIKMVPIEWYLKCILVNSFALCLSFMC